MAISIESLSVSRGGVNLLQGVDIELKNGQAGILRGPNGVGKTTLLRALAGLQPVESGKIKCSFEDICYSGHADGVKPTLTVQENLEFWANIFGSPSISEVAEKFMIIDLLNSRSGPIANGKKITIMKKNARLRPKPPPARTEILKSRIINAIIERPRLNCLIHLKLT